ncbi:heterokaryon incompatibility protein [Apiospora phragmitis]|uniref:Heterokaryon incompatibility protein n=1 Tax=Apiospora phragmitis TaxID=2905665 RepID=A0ABR1UUT2_9PEZI
MIGNRNDTLRATLASATGIDYGCLGSGDHARLAYYSIAERMSWASRRNCTRTEDVAYCLMGLFDINMPMLYGEGKKAFVRLQEEILKETEDHSLFAWAVAEGSDRAWCPSSIFAESPSDFAGCGNIKQPNTPSSGLSAMTKLGLSVDLGETVRPTGHEPHYLCYESYGMLYYTLDCFVDGPNGEDAWVKIALLPVTSGITHHDNSLPSFCRLAIPGIEYEQCSRMRKDHQGQRRVYIRKDLSLHERNVFHHGSISFEGLYACNLTMTYQRDESPGFLTDKTLNDRGGIVKILMDPWTTETVKWSMTQFRARSVDYCTVGIGLGPNKLSFYVGEGKIGAPSLQVAVFDQPQRPQNSITTCVNYRNNPGRLAYKRFTLGERTYRAELFHDNNPSTYGSYWRLHLLVRFSLVKITMTSPLAHRLSKMGSRN